MENKTLHTAGFTETQAVKILAKWKGDANLRKEFGFNFNRFIGYCSGVLSGTVKAWGETDWLTKA